MSPLRPVSLTFVEYEQGDFVGKLMAYSALMPVLLSFGMISVFLARRELIMLALACGVLLNEVANQMLKHAIKEPRPMLREGEKMWSPYGMPSAHSQFMWFLCVFAVLWLERRVMLRERFPVAASLVKRAEQLGWVALASVVCYGRIYLRYHTVTQVLVGAGVGAALGAVWFALCHWLLVPHLFPMIERWPAARMLLIKDSSSVPDVLHFEYQTAMQLRSTQQQAPKPKKSE